MNDFDDGSDRAGVSDIAFELGWSKYLPTTATVLLGMLNLHGPRTMEQLFAAAGLDATSDAWEPYRGRAEEEVEPGLEGLADPAEPLSEGDASAEDAIARAIQIERLNKLATRLGLRPVHSVTDVVKVMVAAGLLESNQRDELRLATRVPLPDEAPELSEREETEEDSRR